MVSRHVERPEVFFNDKTLAFGWHDETGNAAWVAVLAARTREDQVMCGDMQAGVPHLRPGNAPAVAVAYSSSYTSTVWPRSRRMVARMSGPVMALGLV